jgi:hypothetical protein
MIVSQDGLAHATVYAATRPEGQFLEFPTDEPSLIALACCC